MTEEGVKVAVRVRPFNKRELDRKAELIVAMNGNSTIITNPENPKDTKQFTFDHSYWSHDSFKTQPDGILVPDRPESNYASQQQVFEDVGRGLLENAFSGYACSLFAYGQTGSGKSYSMVGYGPNRGLVPIICEELFKMMDENKNPEKNFRVTFSMMEIYNEHIRDLLLADKTKNDGLQVRQSPAHGFYVQGLTQVPVGSYTEIEQRMNQGTARRTVAATNMNATSSRAHTLVNVVFDQVIGTKNAKRKRSIINLVDLAGSERADSSGATGDRLKEGANINRSLSALGNVISALAEKKKVIPYRDSVLTKLLQNALGGNSKTVMIAAISPADINYDETLSTLRYADRVKQIKNKAIVNEDPMESLIRQLKEENERLKESLKSSELPSTIVTVGLSQEEIQKLKVKMREELMEQMKANMAELEAQNQSVFQEKLNQARKEAAEQAAAVQLKSESNGAVLHSKPYLSNLNEDPQLSGVIIHSLIHKQTGIGRKPPNIETSGKDSKQSRIHWIKMQGLSIADEHALLIRHGKTGAEVELRVFPTASRMTKVNGVPVKKSVTLQHKDRILFGSHQLYVFYNPMSEQAIEEKNAGTESEPIDWEFAQRELAQATGFEQLDGKSNKKEDTIIQQQLLELLPMISEVNAIAEELEKHRSFELLLIPPTAQSLKFGEVKLTKIAIRMKDLKTGSIWLWDSGKFKDRRYLMQEMYQNYLEKGSAECSHENDPFWEPLEDCIVGVAPAFLQALAYRLDVDDLLKVTSFEGTQVGSLELKIVPCARSGKTLADLDTSGTGMLDFVEDPSELLGKPYHFKIIISSLKLFDPLGNVKATISYRVFKENEPTTFVVSPNSEHSRIFSIDQFTPEHLDYFSTDFISFIVYCSQTKDDDVPTGYSTSLSPENASPIMRRRSRRYSRASVEELSDASRLKTDLILLQRTLDRFCSKNRKMEDIYNVWANKDPSQENYQALLNEIDSFNKIKINVSLMSCHRGKLSPSHSIPEEDETLDQDAVPQNSKVISPQENTNDDMSQSDRKTMNNNPKQNQLNPKANKRNKSKI